MSTTATVSGVNTGILLEAGTNEVEILAFHVGDQRYGVNVAKVREVLTIDQITAIPESHPSVDGMVRIRDQVVMLVDLQKYLDGSYDQEEREVGKLMLLLEFNEQQLAFRATQIDKIVRASWNQSCPMPDLMGIKAPVTSVVLIDGELLPMLDFESISAVIGMSRRSGGKQQADKANEQNVRNLPIIFAEDSRMIRCMIEDELTEAGFTNLKGFPDGHDAWLYLSGLAEKSTREDIREHVAAVISDVEMPLVDGLNLTRRIRENDVLKELPVILFSSLVSRDNVKKGQQVGASEQISKPKYDELIDTVLSLL